MTERLSSAAPLLAQPERAASWVEHLTGLIDPVWRPGEYDHNTLDFVPNPANPNNRMFVCGRVGCGAVTTQRGICGSCRTERRALNDPVPIEDWVTIPRLRQDLVHDCAVRDCGRTRLNFGLCYPHTKAYRRRRGARETEDYPASRWIAEHSPQPLPAVGRCRNESCWREQSGPIGLCTSHDSQFKKFATRQGVPPNDARSLQRWLDTEVEPLLGDRTYASAAATGFGLLPEPLRWEFLYAVQEVDKTSGYLLNPFVTRSAYLALRRRGVDTVVGERGLGLSEGNKDYRANIGRWQHLIDTAHREWSGVDTRPRDVVFLMDLNLRTSNRPTSRTATMDLRGITQPWLQETVRAWAHGGPRERQACKHVQWAWTLASEVLLSRGTPRTSLGIADMDAVARAIRERWPRKKTQKAHLTAIETVIDFARLDDGLKPYWEQVPASFKIDPARHAAVEGRDESTDSEDEPFRFVPQPIMDWVMDHLGLVEKDSEYATAEARAMVFVHERSGRRPSETCGLQNDCLTYDSDGSPYLEWRRGKKPYVMGPRLPIHQETHDVIREWQRIKDEHGVTSKWLFPSLRSRRADKHLSPATLGARITELITAVQQQAPFESAVEGAEGNLIHFDIGTIDPYAFRHAFAQRLADATDENGRSTTPPEVLQDYMGHKSFATTMGYFEVTAKRRKKALASIPARRIDLLGRAFTVDPEREGFTRIAVTLGHCTEPQNVAANGHECMLEHACESCPFFLVDPLERDGMDAKRQHLRAKYERARAIGAQQHLLDHYQARIFDCTRMIDGIDAYIDNLPDDERTNIREALEHMADIRRRATAPRSIDLRAILRGRSDA